MMSPIEAPEYDAVILAAVSRTPQAAGIQLGRLNQALMTRRPTESFLNAGHVDMITQNHQVFPAQLC